MEKRRPHAERYARVMQVELFSEGYWILATTGGQIIPEHESGDVMCRLIRVSGEFGFERTRQPLQRDGCDCEENDDG
jgi:hypothetical protein